MQIYANEPCGFSPPSHPLSLPPRHHRDAASGGAERPGGRLLVRRWAGGRPHREQEGGAVGGVNPSQVWGGVWGVTSRWGGCEVREGGGRAGQGATAQGRAAAVVSVPLMKRSTRAMWRRGGGAQGTCPGCPPLGRLGPLQPHPGQCSGRGLAMPCPKPATPLVLQPDPIDPADPMYPSLTLGPTDCPQPLYTLP